jgi:hypothetical protein
MVECVSPLSLKLGIKNFKSIDSLELELSDLTILLGPPASGKSNILDALAFIGYFRRFMVLTQEYGGNASNLEPLTLLARFKEPFHLFKHYDLTKTIEVKVLEPLNLDCSISYQSGSLRVLVNSIAIPWDLRTLRSGPIPEVQGTVEKANVVFESRLYGFDRYGLIGDSCTQPHPCGFHVRLSNPPQQARNMPVSILSELGWNAPFVLRGHHNILNDINRELREYLDERIELKMLRSGAIAIFDYDIELDMVSVSETVFRTLYTLLAIRSSLNYVKLHGLEKKFIIVLEEPEAHVFPFFLKLIVEYIEKAIEHVYVVLSTHNPLFVSLLWDRIREVETHYVYRDAEGFTRATKLDMEKMAKDIVTSEELLLMPPSDVVRKYAVGTG